MSIQMKALRLKVERAEEHVTYFEDLVSGRRGSIDTPATASFHYQGEGHPVTYEAILKTPSPEWAIVIGEAIYQLKSTLDHLICDVVFNVTNDPADRALTQFPIFPSQPQFMNHKLYGIFRNRLGDPSAHFTAINKAQPYERNSASPIYDPLFILWELNNIDKHRVILILNNRLNIAAGVPRGFTAKAEKMVEGTERFRVEFPLAVKPSEVNVEAFSPQIVFAEPTSVGSHHQRVTSMLRAIITTTEMVLDDFADFLI